jgi:penicillin-binding protein 1B
VYFGKELKDLSLAEAATIAGMIQSPAQFAPHRHPERARARRNTVIDAMVRDGAITAEDAAAAAREPVAVVPADHTANATAPYFIDYVNRAIEPRIETPGEETAAERQAIYTTLDMELQQLAEASVNRQLDKLKKIYKGQRKPQAALVALNPRNGHVLAMVGGHSYAESQLNRATDARRQPGSVFKPFVYAAALESGISPLSTYTDAPRIFQYDRRASYKPANYGKGYSMRDVTMRTALIRSLNVVTVEVAMRTGLTRVAALAEKFGLPKPEAYPSLALGTTEATPLEIATAYTALANGGRIVKPTVIRGASDDSTPDYSGGEHVAVTRQVVRPSTAYMLTDMLTGVIKQGTARAANGVIKNTAVAGKTGTSRDGWFVGYTANLVCVVWVGFDDNEELGLTGAESALPAWLEFVKGAVDLRPELGGEQFERPAGINFVEIDPETGMLASPACPHRERVAVTGGLAPSSECHKHALPLIASLEEEFYDGTVATEAPVDGDGYSSATYTNTKTHIPQVPSLPRVEASVEAVQVPSRTRTRVEKYGNGRSRLTNDIRVAVPADVANR